MYTSICAFTPESTEQVSDTLQYLCFTKADQQYIDDNLDYALKISNKECQKALKEYIKEYEHNGLLMSWNEERIASCSQKEISDYNLLETRCGFKFKATYLSASKALYDVIKCAIETNGKGYNQSTYKELFNTYYKKYEQVCNISARKEFDTKYGNFIVPNDITSSSEVCIIDPMKY